MAVFGIFFVVYEIGVFVALAVFAVRAGGSVVGPYITAFAHPPSRRNGIPWVLKSIGKAFAWPYVLWDWDQRGRPPSPVLYGEAAAERLGIDPDSGPGFLTKWSAPSGSRPERRSARPPAAARAAAIGRTPSPAGRSAPAPRGAGGHRLPRDILPMMERFGRHEINIMESTDDGSEVFQATQMPLWAFASEDPDGFVRALADACVPAGEWAVYGAERTVVNLVNTNPGTADWYRILDASLAFVRANFVPPMRIPPYAWNRFVETGGTARTWIPLREPPPRETARIAPFTDGMSRLLVRIGKAEDSNRIIARREGDEYVAYVDARQSDEDPTRAQWEFKRASTAYDLYVDVAWSVQVWERVNPEIEPFFPAPKALI